MSAFKDGRSLGWSLLPEIHPQLLYTFGCKNNLKSFQLLGLLAEDVSISAIVFQMFLYKRYVQEPTGNVTGIIRSLAFGSVAYIFSSGCTTKFCTRCQTRESKSPEAPWSYIKIEMNTSINSLAEISIPAVQRVGVSPWTLSLLKMCQWNHEYHRLS